MADAPTGPPEQRGSVRPVTLEGDPDKRTYMCEVRILQGTGLRPGDIVWVEFGAYWTEVGGAKIRQKGQWRQCEVLPLPVGTAADVHVKLAPDPKTAPQIFD